MAKFRAAFAWLWPLRRSRESSLSDLLRTEHEVLERITLALEGDAALKEQILSELKHQQGTRQ